jgi:hypothetical protein
LRRTAHQEEYDARFGLTEAGVEATFGGRRPSEVAEREARTEGTETADA